MLIITSNDRFFTFYFSLFTFKFDLGKNTFGQFHQTFTFAKIKPI